jgi:hypothetical protein
MTVEDLLDQAASPSPPAVTAGELPEMHAQLLALPDRGDYVTRAARIVADLHRPLLAFPGADPRSVSQVVHELIVGLRRGPLSSLADSRRFDVAGGWLDNIRMQRRASSVT